MGIRNISTTMPSAELTSIRRNLLQKVMSFEQTREKGYTDWKLSQSSQYSIHHQTKEIQISLLLVAIRKQ